MGFAEKRGDYWRGRYKLGPGKYGTVKDATGATVRFRTKRDAERAANDAEANVRTGARPSLVAGPVKFGDYASRWYAAQDLAASTMQNYRRHIEEHLLPAFDTREIGDISARMSPPGRSGSVRRAMQNPVCVPGGRPCI